MSKIDHLQPGYTDQAREVIEKLGGKLGGLQYLIDHDPQVGDLILPMVTIEPDQKWNGSLPTHNGKLIVRGSHKNDFQGLVDVLETKVVGPGGVRDAIEEIRAQARSGTVIDYGRSENPNYDGKVVVGVQAHGGNYRGSVVEHPNKPGQYVISLVQAIPSITRPMDITATGIYHYTTGFHEIMRGDKDELSCAKNAVDVYRRIRASGLVRDDLSFQMEFLEDSDKRKPEIKNVCQVRAFVPFEAPGKFDVPGKKERLTFGVTPEEGIVLPLYQSPDGLDYNGNPIDPSNNWALLKTYHNQTTPFPFQPQNLAAYLIAQEFYTGLTPSLEHNHFRLAQKADITVFENGNRYHDDFTALLYSQFGGEKNTELLKELCLDQCLRGQIPQALRDTAGNLNTKVRVISNGTHASVEAIVE